MKKLSISIILTVMSLSCLTCSDGNSPTQPAQVIVTVSNECICNVFLYTEAGLCIQSKIWDCKETKALVFNIYYQGVLTVKGEYRGKTASQTITTQYGKTSAVDILF